MGSHSFGIQVQPKLSQGLTSSGQQEARRDPI